MTDGAVSLLHGGERLFSEGLKAAAGVGEGDAAAETIEQGHAQLFFEGLDLRRDVGLHSVDALGGAGKAQFFGENAKDLKLADFHPGRPSEIEGKKRIARGCGWRARSSA